MIASVQTLVFGFALGFAISAIVSNVFQLVTNGQSAFHIPVTTDARRLAIVGLLLVAGPHILFSAAKRSVRIGDWPMAYVAGCLALGAVWAFVLGFFVIRLASA
jgi:uncharacterized membrane protein YidH (DUF202 family)